MAVFNESYYIFNFKVNTIVLFSSILIRFLMGYNKKFSW